MMPEEADTQSQQQVEGYLPVPEDEEKETMYIATTSGPSEDKEKYLELEAEVQKTWWDHQINRTYVAGLISIAFIALIASLVFLLPCTEQGPPTTMDPGYATEIVYIVDEEEMV